MNNMSTNIADIALTAYKTMQKKQRFDFETGVKAVVVSLGFEIIKNSFLGKPYRSIKIKKLFLLGGLLLIGLNQLKVKQTLV